MFVSALHITLDFGVGLFDLHGTLLFTEATTLVGVALIQLWWAISFMAGAQGNGSGVLSAGILGLVWAALTNGFPIVYCPPVCAEGRPLTDVAHVGSIVFGILLGLVAIWTLWRARVRPGWFMPAVALALAIGTVVSLANAPIVEQDGDTLARVSTQRLAQSLPHRLGSPGGRTLGHPLASLLLGLGPERVVELAEGGGRPVPA